MGSELTVHTHVKDAVRHPDGRPEEMPVGKGSAPFAECVAALDAVGYDGFFTVESEGGENRLEDIRAAVEVIRAL